MTDEVEAPPPSIELLGPAGLLRKVPMLATVDDEALTELFARTRKRSYPAGSTIVSELEPGAEVFILVRGEAEVSVDTTRGDRQVIGQLGPGSGFGEMSSLTGELRSATVTATRDVEALVISDGEFDRLRERRPEIAIALISLLAGRLVHTEKAIAALLASETATAPEDARAQAILHAKGAGGKLRKGSIRLVFQELVVARRRDLAFLTLAAFVVTLLAVRLAVYVSFRFDMAPRGVLRAAYMTGFASLVGSACASLLTFRPGVRRVIALLYGVGVALIFNELGVTLAFDIFYKDIHTADPNLPFDVERLYDRGAAVHAIVIGLAVLIQAAYLRRFYARVLFVLATRVRKVLSR
jgi:CRP-like cAMP-binding protein